MKTDRERDAAVEQLLAAALRESARDGDACPESADLAAFVEGTLSPHERQTIEQHAAACERCLRALALMAESPLPAPDPAAGWRAWLSIARLSWVIPATAAAAVILYIAVTPVIAPFEMARSGVRNQAHAPAPATPAPIQPQAPDSFKAAEAAQPLPSTAAKAGQTSSKRARRQQRGQVASADAVQRAPVLDQLVPPTRNIQQDQAISPKAVTSAPQAGAPAATPTPAAPQTVTQVPPTTRTFDQLQTLQVQVQAPSTTVETSQTASRVMPARAVSTQAPPRGAAELTVMTTAMVQAPGSSVRWRLDGDGRISRSQDSGLSWQEQQYRSPSELLALSAPTPFTCWVAGRSGTIILTTDGERWERRPFPEQVDLISVDAHDRRQAIVTTRDGRRFSTADGGTTWTELSRERLPR